MRPHLTPRLWSAQEDQYVRDNFLSSTVAQMAADLGRTTAAVRTRKTTLGLGGKWRPWRAEEVETLRAFYEAHKGQALDLPALARRMSRSVVALALKAGDLGLTDQQRPSICRDAWTADEDAVVRAHPELCCTELASLLGRSAAAIAKRRRTLGVDRTPQQRRVAQARKWILHAHPRGALGLKHSSATKARLSVASAAMWVRHKETGSGLMTEKNRQLLSDRMALMQATDPRLRQGFSHGASGTRADLGIYVRSRWEANIARYLKWLQERGEIHAWAYEAKTFWFEHIKRGTRSYTPDFEIIERPGCEPHYWEVKGYKHPRGQTALARMERYYPEVSITIIDEDAYKAIAKWKALIPYWEAGHGSHRG